jgi:hypothetical protein
MESRQLAIPGLDPQEDHRLEFGKHLFSFTQFFGPRLLLFVQPLELDLPPFLTQTVKTQNPFKGE